MYNLTRGWMWRERQTVVYGADSSLLFFGNNSYVLSKAAGNCSNKKGRNREYHYIWVAKKLFCVCEDELELIRHTLIYLLTLLQTN